MKIGFKIQQIFVNVKSRGFTEILRSHCATKKYKFWASSGASSCQSCRSCKMLQNIPLVAKIGFDTAETRPSKVWPISGNHPTPKPPGSNEHLWPLYPVVFRFSRTLTRPCQTPLLPPRKKIMPSRTQLFKADSISPRFRQKSREICY